jgi:hypothetical protein
VNGVTRSARRRPDVVLLAIAIVVSVVVMYNVGNMVGDDRCLDAGGRIEKGPEDRICRAADGSRLAISVIPASATGWAAALAFWAALVAVVYLPLARYFPEAASRHG